MSVAPNKRSHKGRGFERRIVTRVQRYGHRARQLSHSEQSSYRRGHPLNGVDVIVEFCGIDITVQCRAHEQGFEKVYDSLRRAQISCAVMGNEEPVISMRISDWLTHLHFLKKQVTSQPPRK